MLDQLTDYFTITDLKQYTYCPRILYYHACLPGIRPTTFKMEAGIEAHQSEPKRAMRRSMHLDSDQIIARHFDLTLTSETLGLSAQIDEVIDMPDEFIPVDYKLAKRSGYHFKLQLCAYALLLEEHFACDVARGFLYLIPRRRAEEVVFDKKLRRAVRKSLQEMHTIRMSESMPPPTPQRRRCTDCEFRKFCNDV